MGNTESNVTSGVKKQAGVSTQGIYFAFYSYKNINVIYFRVI